MSTHMPYDTTEAWIGITLVKKWSSFSLGNSVFFRHVFRCIRLLSPRAKFSFFFILLVQSMMSLLDLVGLALIMKIVLSNQTDPSAFQSPILDANSFVNNLVNDYDPSALLFSIISIFILKGVVSLFLSTLIIRLLAAETEVLFARLMKLIFGSRTGRYRKLTTQDISYALHNATEIVFKDTLVPISVIVADIVLLFLISVNLFFSAKVLFLPTVLYFILTFSVLRSLEKRVTRSAYQMQWKSEISSRGFVEEATASLRELYVSAKLDWFLEKLKVTRGSGIRAGSIISVAQLRPKYFYEMALFGGVGVIALVSVYSGNRDSIFAFLTLFVVSSSRMIPSLLRIQFYLGVFQKSAEQTERIFEVLDVEALSTSASADSLVISRTTSNCGSFTASLSLENVIFSYSSDRTRPELSDVSFRVEPGESVAIVGPSGAGKSTLVDLVLGYLQPDSGQVLISGMLPSECFSTWPGRVAYVPQKVTIFQGTLLQNVALGTTASSEVDLVARNRVSDLLEKVGLRDFVDDLDRGLDAELATFGTSLSGGQVQRIGIARALFSDPAVVVFDESTSSLDSVSEREVMDLLLGFRGQKTMIFIAHRLSTVKTADRIIYLDQGRIVAQGNFEELRQSVPAFNQQVKNLDVTT